ncbi:hypothetical protein BDEG_22319 [Batrachochytrium dendrobatidis JEL423]|uniref:SCP domain-containing protein n=1 Tax=Batrachochytrium dendrobatidis (strain JEL423) TaxID=403673 RepID=A0A177WE40_BATDL|nr:hypothetical protein BDEG_22319 [Batrachochytrium dendrobatidis JEL423]
MKTITVIVAVLATGLYTLVGATPMSASNSDKQTNDSQVGAAGIPLRGAPLGDWRRRDPEKMEDIENENKKYHSYEPHAPCSSHTTQKHQATTVHSPPRSPTHPVPRPIPSHTPHHPPTKPSPKPLPKSSPKPSPKPLPKPLPKPSSKPLPKPLPKPSPKPPAPSPIRPPPRQPGNSGLVGVQPLSWSRSEESSAQSWANYLAATNTLSHSRSGENLDRATGNINLDCVHGLQTFFAEYSQYDGRPISLNAQFEKYGHYTQLVWRGTTQVGCATSRSGQAQYLVCHYTPPGNILGLTAPMYHG